MPAGLCGGKGNRRISYREDVKNKIFFGFGGGCEKLTLCDKKKKWPALRFKIFFWHWIINGCIRTGRMKPLVLILAVFLITSVAYAPNVGETSHWGIVITRCQYCNGTNNLEVHHVIPQAECKRIGKPALIYDTNNMVVLCRGSDGKGCHYYIGHHGRGWTNVFTNVIDIIKQGKKQ